MSVLERHWTPTPDKPRAGMAVHCRGVGKPPQVLRGSGEQDLVLDLLKPRSRSRSSLRMRFICANRTSIFLRSRRDCWKASVLASALT